MTRARMQLNADRVRTLEGALTVDRLDRLLNLAAFGPLANCDDTDDRALLSAGWIKKDGRSVDLVDGATGTLFDDNGGVRQIWLTASMRIERMND